MEAQRALVRLAHVDPLQQVEDDARKAVLCQEDFLRVGDLADRALGRPGVPGALRQRLSLENDARDMIAWGRGALPDVGEVGWEGDGDGAAEEGEGAKVGHCCG